CIGIAMFGSIPANRYVSRLTAEPGEMIAVSGTIGNGALGLDVRQGKLDIDTASNQWLSDRYRIPQPLQTYAAIVREFASASMDISDGLLGDLTKLCSASHVGATIERNQIPISNAVGAAVNVDPELWERILDGGDDYEILFTVPSDRFELCRKTARQMDAAITAIGKTHAGPAGKVTLQLDGNPVPVNASSWSHF
ncbi:MAG: thiamine-phosphate kinase, partial [Rhizobiaceae bacterium]